MITWDKAINPQYMAIMNIIFVSTPYRTGGCSIFCAYVLYIYIMSNIRFYFLGNNQPEMVYDIDDYSEVD